MFAAFAVFVVSTVFAVFAVSAVFVVPAVFAAVAMSTVLTVSIVFESLFRNVLDVNRKLRIPPYFRSSACETFTLTHRTLRSTRRQDVYCCKYKIT